MDENTRERSFKFFDNWFAHLIFRFTLPQKIISKCLNIDPKKKDSRDSEIATLSLYYFSKPPKQGYQNGYPIRPANIKKIINDYLDKKAFGITLPKDPTKNFDFLQLLIKSCNDVEMLGLHLWKIYRKAEKESLYKDLLVFLLVDGYLIESMTKELDLLRSIANRLENEEENLQKQKQDLNNKRQEAVELQEQVKNLKLELEKRPTEVKKEPIDTIKVSRIKSKNKELSEKVKSLKNQIAQVADAQAHAQKSDQRSEDLNSRINRTKSILPEVVDMFTQTKGKIKAIRSEIAGLNKAIAFRKEIIIKKDKPILDLFIDSYDLWRNTSSEYYIDFDLFKEWITAFFPKHDLNSITLLVKISDKKGGLIRRAKEASFNVEFLQSHSWISALSCRLMESRADTVCLVASNPQFSALSRAFNKQNRKFFFAFPKEKMPEDLRGGGFIPLEEKNYTRRKYDGH